MAARFGDRRAPFIQFVIITPREANCTCRATCSALSGTCTARDFDAIRPPLSQAQKSVQASTCRLIAVAVRRSTKVMGVAEVDDVCDEVAQTLG